MALRALLRFLVDTPQKHPATSIKLHPDSALSHSGQGLDYFTGVMIGLGCIPFVLGNVVIVIHRDYSPIKTKAVELTVMSSLGGLIWVASNLVVNNHFGREKRTIWAICPLWTFWLQVCFGFALWLNCMTVRLFNLHLIFIRKVQKIRRLKHIALPLFLLQLPAILFSAAASVLKGSKFEEEREDCKIQGPHWSIGILVLFPLYFFVFLALAFTLRNIMAQYNEFRLIRKGGILSLFMFLLSLVTIETKEYQAATGRCFLSFCVAGTVFYYFWGRNATVVYNVLFHKEEYLRTFIAMLQASPDTGSARDLYPDVHPNMDLRLQQAREDTSLLRNHVRELEEKIAVLKDLTELYQAQAASRH